MYRLTEADLERLAAVEAEAARDGDTRRERQAAYLLRVAKAQDECATPGEVCAALGVARQSLHRTLARYRERPDLKRAVPRKRPAAPADAGARVTKALAAFVGAVKGGASARLAR